jgi:hypothetical protein
MYILKGVMLNDKISNGDFGVTKYDLGLSQEID